MELFINYGNDYFKGADGEDEDSEREDEDI